MNRLAVSIKDQDAAETLPDVTKHQMYVQHIPRVAPFRVIIGNYLSFSENATAFHHPEYSRQRPR